MSIMMYRVDGRMLHGQVIATFAKALSLDSYVVVNEEVASSPKKIEVLKLVVPKEAKLAVYSPCQFAKAVEKGELSGQHLCVVFRYLEDALASVNLGVAIDKLMIGGMFQRIGKEAENLGIALMVSPEDKICFRELAAKKIELTYQVSYFNKEIPLKEVVNY